MIFKENKCNVLFLFYIFKKKREMRQICVHDEKILVYSIYLSLEYY